MQYHRGALDQSDAIQRQPAAEPTSTALRMDVEGGPRGAISRPNGPASRDPDLQSRVLQRLVHGSPRQAAQQQSLNLLLGGAATPRRVVAGALPERNSAAPVQGVFDATDFASLVTEQRELQKYPATAFEGGFTTVGFEHEFAQVAGGPLKGLTHVEIADSVDKLPFTGLGFFLETDADDAIELVSPPFLVELIAPDQAVPNPDHVAAMDRMIRARLSALVDQDNTVATLAAAFKTDPGITFNLRDAAVTSSNVNPDAKVPEGRSADGLKATLPKAQFSTSKVKASRKVGHKIDISSQVNFATTASVYGDIETLRAADALNDYDKVFVGIQSQIKGFIDAARAASVAGLTVTGGLNAFTDELARMLAGHMALRSRSEAEARKAEMFARGQQGRSAAKRLSEGKAKKLYQLHTGMRSHVKDVKGVWLKDTIVNFGLGLLSTGDWQAVGRLAVNAGVRTALGGLTVPATGFDVDEKKELSANLAEAKVSMVAALQQLAINIAAGGWGQTQPDQVTAAHGPGARLSFGDHDAQWLGLRQDTYIPASKVARPPGWEGGRLHVVEGRGDALRSLYELKVLHLLRQTPRPSDKAIAEAVGESSEDRPYVTEAWVREIRERVLGP